MLRPQTIQIFLPTGSPTGVKEAELTSRLIKVLYFPRTTFDKASEREISQYTGVYFLFGEDEQGNPMTYIGEGENCWERLKAHQRKKEFWTSCIIASTKTNDYNKTDAKYLEHLCLKIAKEVNRYKFDNDKDSSLPSISESREADLLDHFDTIKILVGSLGFPLFEPTRGNKTVKAEEKFYCNVKEVKAEAILTDEGVLVLKGSTAQPNHTGSTGNWIINIRQKLIESEALTESNGMLEFAKDTLFKSPSAASGAILGRPSNGWKAWKDAKGKTLDELKRN